MALAQTEFSRRLRRQRELAGLSQKAAADKIGVSDRNYLRWERGTSMPHPANIDRIARALNIDVEHFLEPFDKGDQLDRVEAKLDESNRLLRQLVAGVEGLLATPARIEELAGDIAYLRHLAGETAQPAASQAGSSSRETQRSAHRQAS